ncbi:carbonic anhydrase [Gemmatimonas sp.]|uniref:carbonic anhydrase n=1 Tax=Gemmatimonas sp. TaxID=1962908 RepID=UPI0025BF979E|nr:carbonic anhydrase [Gemmatimonas sp.]MCA2995899.1 carbonic anhydrase [Gemmatimonas sp.]
MCTSCDIPTPRPSRRAFLHSATVAGAALLGGSVASGALAAPAWAHGSPRTMPDPFPDAAAALAALYEGNARFVNGQVMAPNRNMARLKEVAAGQKPFAAFLGCADSRVPIEIVFDQGFGDIFVTRIAGNVADPAIIGSLEFGTEVLGAQVLYVLGHTKCGAVSAAMAGNEVPGQISTLYQHLRRAAKESGGDVNRAIARNVEVQAEILKEASPVIARRVKAGTLVIAGGVYDLDTGTVTPVSV